MLKSLNNLGAHVSAFVVAFGGAMAFAGSALASSADVKGIVQQTGGQLQHVGDLVNIAAYGGGAVLTGTGLLNFKKHVDNPSQNELRKAIGPGVVGIALLAFPTFAGYLDHSVLNGAATNRGFENNAFDANFGS